MTKLIMKVIDMEPPMLDATKKVQSSALILVVHK